MKTNTIYNKDILDDGFEQTTISLKNDYEGEAISILIRRLASVPSTKAILYIHGFNDYYFQTELADQFNNHEFNFYALDLRKYGRALLSHQKFNDIQNLKDYYEEIIKALDIIHSENNKEVILFGHSTGGLILTLFAKDHSGENLFNAVILNSPFFEFNQSKFVKKMLPIVSYLGGLVPKFKIAGGFTKEYGKSMHQSGYGEWDYNLNWKPHVPPKINIGWIRAIYRTQRELQTHFTIQQPVLVMHSDKSVDNMQDREQMQTRDSILNVKDIEEIARNIDGDTDIVTINGGVHDLILSRKEVRENVYHTIFQWIKSHNI